MSFFGWALTFIGLGLVALVIFGLLGLRLWRQAKELGGAAARAGESLSRIGSRTPSGGWPDPE